jgi:DNA repair protein RadC
MQEAERPRERLWTLGPEALKTSELLAILIRTGLQGKSALALAEEILTTYPTLDELCRVPSKKLAGIKGIGMAKAVQLKACFELAARLAGSRRREVPMDTPDKVEAYLGTRLRMLDHETLHVLVLDTRLRLKGEKQVSNGTLNETPAHPRDILGVAIDHNGYGFILVHNHPSGDPAPSPADLEFTRRMRDAAQLMEIPMLDHVILGRATEARPKSYYSFREAGYL